jgi:hypothetical protein
MKKKNHSRAWLEGKSYHCIREEMLASHAWRAASHLQRSMVLAMLTELGQHGGRDNGNLIFTNRDFRAFGISYDAIKPNLAAIEALGLLDQKRGRPGTKGYGRARRILLPFMPILDENGKEIEPPTDPWARFNTTKEAKMAARKAYKRAKKLSAVIQKSDHVARKCNRRSSAKMPMDIGSRSRKSDHDLDLKKLTTASLQGM